MAFNSATAQFMFGSASFLSPYLYSCLVPNVGRDRSNVLLTALAALVPSRLPWVSLYWLFALISALTLAAMWMARFPSVELSSGEAIGTWPTLSSVLRKPVVLLYFVSTFAYVGSEQGTADWMSQFLKMYHHFDAHTAGAYAVSWFWGLLTVGCLVGMILLKFFDSTEVLIAFSSAAIASLTVALFGTARWSLIAFPAIGLFASVMWPTIISLALNCVAEYHGSVSGVLCTGICGGAIVPVIMGKLGDLFGLQVGMLSLYVTFGWVLSVGFWAKPLVRNKVIGWS